MKSNRSCDQAHLWVSSFLFWVPQSTSSLGASSPRVNPTRWGSDRDSCKLCTFFWSSPSWRKLGFLGRVVIRDRSLDKGNVISQGQRGRDACAGRDVSSLLWLWVSGGGPDWSFADVKLQIHPEAAGLECGVEPHSCKWDQHFNFTFVRSSQIMQLARGPCLPSTSPPGGMRGALRTRLPVEPSKVILSGHTETPFQHVGSPPAVRRACTSVSTFRGLTDLLIHIPESQGKDEIEHRWLYIARK